MDNPNIEYPEPPIRFLNVSERFFPEGSNPAVAIGMSRMYGTTLEGAKYGAEHSLKIITAHGSKGRVRVYDTLELKMVHEIEN